MRLGPASLAAAIMSGGHAAAQVAPVQGIREAQLRVHAIVGVQVIAAPGRATSGATIVIRDGVIEAVGEGVEPPPDARLWSGEGLTAYPGLIDAAVLVDPQQPEAPGAAAHWNARVRPERSAAATLPPESLRGTLRKMGFTAAAVYPASGIFRGSGAVFALAEDDADVRVYRERGAMAVGFDRAGWGADGYPSSLMGAIALLRQTLQDARWYAECVRIWRADPAGHEPPPHEAALAALCDVAAGTQALLFDAPSEQEVLRAARIAAEFGLEAAVLGGGTEFRRLDDVVAAGVPLIVPLSFPARPEVSSLAEERSVSLRDMLTWEQAPTNPRRLLRAGATIALTTQRLEKRGDFPANLHAALNNGLDETEALAALTTTPAALLGLAEIMGTIEPGKVANLVLVEGSLFARRPKVRETWINGRRHEVTPRPPATFEGEGTLVARLGDDQETRARVQLDTSARRLSVHGPGGARSRARKVSVSHDRIDAVIDGSAFDAPGYVRLEGVIVGGRVVGTAALPDGRHAAFTISPAEAEPQQPVLARDAPAPPPQEGVEPTPPEPASIPEPDGPAPPQFAAAATGAAAAEAPQDEPPQRFRRWRGGGGEPPAAPGGEGQEDQPEDDREERPLEPPPQEILLPLGACGLAAPPRQQAVAVVGATLWTCGPQGIIENGALLVRDGRIEYAGGAAGFEPPRDALVIDGAGRHVTPGLIDCHSHTGIDGGVNEGAQAVTAEVRIGDVIDPDDIDWYRHLAGGLTIANQLHGSANPIGGQNSVVKIRWGAGAGAFPLTGAIAGIKFALGENVKRSAGRYPSTRMGVETIIRDAFTAAREYRCRHERYRSLSEQERSRTMPPRVDLELEVLVEVLDGRRIVHCHSYRQDEILMLIRLAEEFGFTVGTFQHVLEGYKIAEAIAAHGAGASTFSDWWAYKVEVMDAIPFNGALMHEVGVVVSFNSDSAELARRLNTEAAKAVRYGGVEAQEALLFVTLNPARQLRIDDRVGSLEAGKDGDFAVWSASPLSAYARCEQTWIEGARHFDLETDAAMRDHARAERQRLVQKILAAAHGHPGASRGTGDIQGDAPAAEPSPQPPPGSPSVPTGPAGEGDDDGLPYSCCRSGEP
jgi:N-acetylglucosamine-6-phosphate deacetylase